MDMGNKVFCANMHGVVAISITQHRNSVGFNLLVVRGLCRGVAEAETTA